MIGVELVYAGVEPIQRQQCTIQGFPTGNQFGDKRIGWDSSQSLKQTKRYAVKIMPGKQGYPLSPMA
ncbi:hypothetical protein SKAU_G00189710 [Synaphobranchus kaupii]|uniref:Uncharacterized protein n=1 Tax=Synaphobranchus kaupii TaxID=118154 RepID=A0A9Q1FDG0_SYNKA|nr:hypothetical protein SKAU_G00189710 [Synaphobranchus kaupii]